MRIFRRLSAFFWIGSFGALWLLSCSAPSDVDTSSPVREQDEFPPFQLQTLDGETRTLDDYLNELTLVSFFFPT